MPTYEYICDNCGDKFEALQSMKDEPLKKCIKCGKEKLRKLISGGAGLIFKGSGFYLTDYKNKPQESSTSSSSSKPAETKTDSKSDNKTETKSTDTKGKESKASSSSPKPDTSK